MRDQIDFRHEEVGKLFRRFLLPTVLGMVSAAVFIVTDGIFVGRGIGSDALAAVNLVAPIYTLATGFGLMFGMGGSVVASINLARGKSRVAGINATQAILVPTLLIVVITALLLGFRDTILHLLGTPEALMEQGREYLVWFTVFLPAIALFDILMFIVRLDGAPRFVMACNLGAAGINIVLDYLFIFHFGWGLAGAAVATGIGYVLGTLVMLGYMLRRSQTLHLVRIKLSATSLRLTARNINYMARVGFPALLSEMAISCMMIAGNYAFIRYVGKEGVAAYSIACYLFPIIFMVYSGIVQAAQPIISFNHGAGEPIRIRKALKLALITVTGCGLLFFVATWFGAGSLVGLFLSPEAPAYAIATAGLPYFAIGYVFFGINVVMTGYLQSIERSRYATGLTLIRGIGLMVGAFLLLPRWLGAEGIWLSVPAAEAATAIFIIFAARRTRKKTYGNV